MLRARSAACLPQAGARHFRGLTGCYRAPCRVLPALPGLSMLTRGACRLRPARRRHLHSRLSPAYRTSASASAAHCAGAAVVAGWLRPARRRHACCASANARGTRCAAAAAAAAAATPTCHVCNTTWDVCCAAAAAVVARQRRQRPRQQGCAQALCRPCRARVQARAVTRRWQHEHAARADAVQRLCRKPAGPREPYRAPRALLLPQLGQRGLQLGRLRGAKPGRGKGCAGRVSRRVARRAGQFQAQRRQVLHTQGPAGRCGGGPVVAATPRLPTTQTV